MSTCHVLTLFCFLYSKIDGETLDRALSSKPAHLYTVVLFYASWCPFSHGVRANFDVLSSMFPQIRHLAVEQSSTMPRLDDSDAFYLLSMFMYTRKNYKYTSFHLSGIWFRTVYHVSSHIDILFRG